MRKSWYNASAARSVHVVAKPAGLGPSRRLHPRTRPRLGECLLYPLVDGPGVAILVVVPPVLFFQSLPIFDVISIIDPFNRGNWAIGLLVLPILVPMLFSFAMVFGYVLVYFGHLFVASAMGEPDHPRWPEWDAQLISEGLGRWIWAGVFGLAIGGLPVIVYWLYCGDIDWFDRVIIFDLIVIGASYALMSLAASLLHESLVAANPVTVVAAISRVGWDFLMPSVLGGISLLLAAGAIWCVAFLIPVFKLAILGLWGFWVLSLYETMVLLRMLGLTYHAHSQNLVWFSTRPRWASSRFGKIYANM